MSDRSCVVRDWFSALQARDLEQISARLTPTFCFWTPIESIATGDFLSMLRGVFVAFPDWHCNPREFNDVGQETTVVFDAGGTQTGIWELPHVRNPIAPTGKYVTVSDQAWTFRTEGGKVSSIFGLMFPT